MQGKNFTYLEKLDHLRLLAAVIVLMFHVEWLFPHVRGWNIPIFHEGHSGVALFMVISGFILAAICYGKDIDIPRFYANRALRIYPLWIAVVALGYFARPASDPLMFMPAFLPISNVFSRDVYGAYGGQFWSIAVELQFYLLFPVIVLAIERHGWRFLLAVVSLLIVLRGGVFWFYGSVHNLAYFTIFGAMDAFLSGVVAGRIYMQRDFRVPWWVPFLLLGLANLALWQLFSNSFFHVDWTDQGRQFSNARSWVLWPPLRPSFSEASFSPI